MDGITNQGQPYRKGNWGGMGGFGDGGSAGYCVGLLRSSHSLELIDDDALEPTKPDQGKESPQHGNRHDAGPHRCCDIALILDNLQ